MSREAALRARMRTPVPAGMRAAFDRQRAAIFAVQAAWPNNEHVYDDELVERAIRDRLDLEWQLMEPGSAYVLWGDGRAVPVEPHPDVLALTVAATAPRLAASACDRCGQVGCVGVAPVAAPPYLVGLVLCGPCASYVNPDPFLTPDQGDDA